jgi:LPXTG-motif cell wall-anchored protein
VKVATPVCDNDVPYLQYTVVGVSSTDKTVTIVWKNPSGADVVYAGQPLSGRVLWPGAVVDSAGKPVDWPGWHKAADGTWVQGDEFNWAHASVLVEFKVNAEAKAVVTVAYPASTCKPTVVAVGGSPSPTPTAVVGGSPSPTPTTAVAATSTNHTAVSATTSSNQAAVHPTTTASSSGGLAMTGSNGRALAILAAALVLAGVTLAFVARRRRRSA